MKHYKSWSGLNQQLNDLVCDGLKGHLTYFCTSYSSVHNSYGRASIRFDGKELVCFSWVDTVRQECQTSQLYRETSMLSDNIPALSKKWNEDGTLSNRDFLSAATDFLQLSIKDALESENYIIRILAIVDRRIGKNTLQQLMVSKVYQTLPEWVRQFYELRLSL